MTEQLGSMVACRAEAPVIYSESPMSADRKAYRCGGRRERKAFDFQIKVWCLEELAITIRQVDYWHDERVLEVADASVATGATFQFKPSGSRATVWAKDFEPKQSHGHRRPLMTPTVLDARYQKYHRYLMIQELEAPQ